jgi:hypothetical protein
LAIGRKDGWPKGRRYINVDEGRTRQIGGIMASMIARHGMRCPYGVNPRRARRMTTIFRISRSVRRDENGTGAVLSIA